MIRLPEIIIDRNADIQWYSFAGRCCRCSNHRLPNMAVTLLFRLLPTGRLRRCSSDFTRPESLNSRARHDYLWPPVNNFDQSAAQKSIGRADEDANEK
jgi:hypothetical protein